MEERVFSKDEFAAAAKENGFVLLELDYPQTKEVPAEVMAKREALSEKYAIEAFPTLYFTDAEGRPFGEAPLEFSTEAWPEILKDARAQGSKIATMLNAAATLEGVEKAKALANAMEMLPAGVMETFYPEVGEQIIASDPDDVTGYGAKLAAQLRQEEFDKKLNEFANEGEWDAAIALTDETIAEEQTTTEQKQDLLWLKAQLLAEKGDMKAVLKSMEAAIEVAPDSDLAAQMKEIYPQIKAEVDAAEVSETPAE